MEGVTGSFHPSASTLKAGNLRIDKQTVKISIAQCTTSIFSKKNLIFARPVKVGFSRLKLLK